MDLNADQENTPKSQARKRKLEEVATDLEISEGGKDSGEVARRHTHRGVYLSCHD